MSSRSALVTGATGFIGSHLVRHLRSEGWRVVAVVRAESPAGRRAELEEAGAELANVDGTIESLRQAMRTPDEIDVVYHLATLFRAEHTPDDVELLIRDNVLFGAQLLEAMHLERVERIVIAGSAWEHHENREYSPVSLYAATKAAFVTLLRYYVEVRRVRACVLDLTDTYGPGDSRPKLLRLLHDASESGEFLSMNAGEPWIDLLHVSDAAAAFALAAERLIEAPGPVLERWSVRPGRPLRLRDLVATYERVLGRKIPVRWGERPYRAREAMIPWSSGTVLPGWAPRVELEEGLRSLTSGRSSPAC